MSYIDITRLARHWSVRNLEHVLIIEYEMFAPNRGRIVVNRPRGLDKVNDGLLTSGRTSLMMIYSSGRKDGPHCDVECHFILPADFILYQE